MSDPKPWWQDSSALAYLLVAMLVVSISGVVLSAAFKLCMWLVKS